MNNTFKRTKCQERYKIAKTLMWTELGHIKEYFRLVGSKFGLSGLVK